jgi:hypothetical protein
MYRSGDYSPREISDSLKVPKTTVHNWIHAAGITRGEHATKAGARASASASNGASESELVRSLRARVRKLEGDCATLKATIAIMSGAA